MNAGSGASARPVSDQAFARALAALGPFETRPRVAVAVSGGADSLALVLLADTWARNRGGEAIGLTVDHRLRPGSAAEAEQVGGWLAAKGIAHRILVWEAPRPGSGVQAAARAARYRLLAEWCAGAGILHLLLGHHCEDQAETVLLRLAGNSGIEGAAGMTAVRELPGVRLLRPLLGVPRADLRAILEDRGQDWIEDPTNRDLRFARPRLRARAAAFEGAGLTPSRLAALGRGLGAARRALEAATSAFLAHACRVYPAGYVELDADALAALRDVEASRALARIVTTIGAGSYAPKRESLARLQVWTQNGKNAGVTLGGCHVSRQPDHFLFCREARNLPPPEVVVAGRTVVWDRRFRLEFEEAAGKGGATLSALGEDGWAEVVAREPAHRNIGLPHPVRRVLPALRDERGVVSVPFLDYLRNDGPGPAVALARIVFRPPNPMSGMGFCFASADSDTMFSEGWEVMARMNGAMLPSPSLQEGMS